MNFITVVSHAGNNSLVEAMYFNVPMIAIPFFGKFVILLFYMLKT